MKLFIAVLLSSFTVFSVSGNVVWDLKKDSEGIKVYTAKMQNSNVKAVKVECMVDAGFPQLIALLYDTDKHHEWVYNTKISKTLKKAGDDELIYHSVVNTPWPFTSRDFIAHLKVSQPSPDVMIIKSQAEPKYIPENKDLVRVQKSQAQWTVTALDNNSLKIEYTVQFDPGGSVPSWLINMFVTEGPYETFKKLKQRIKSPAYAKAQYSFLKAR